MPKGHVHSTEEEWFSYIVHPKGLDSPVMFVI